MTCDPYSIQCSIDHLGKTLTSFNVNDLIATAIATVISVIIGGVITLFITRAATRDEAKRARKLRNEERLDVALDRLIWEINGHCVVARKEWEQQQASEPVPEWREPDFGILAAVAAARMVATDGDEKKVLDAIRKLTLDVRNMDVKTRVSSLTLVWRTLILWRDGEELDKVLESIAIVNEPPESAQG